MDNAGSREAFLFEISAEAFFQYVVRVTLFDKENNIVLAGSEYPVKEILARGLYTIRLESNGNIEDTVILVSCNCQYLISNSREQKNGAVALAPPRIYSSAPLNEKVFASSLEYYIRPASMLAKVNTWAFNGQYANSSLYLFFHFYTRERYQQLKSENKIAQIKAFRLLNHLGMVAFDFAWGPGVAVDEEDGWLMFNGMLPPGLYLLEYTGEEPRQVPVYILEGFHTQVFLFIDEQPVFASLRMFIQHEWKFDPYDLRNVYTDLLFVRLQNKDIAIDEGMVSAIKAGELPALMLHLLYAYIAVSTGNGSVEELTGVVMEELYKMHTCFQGPLPDWRALCILKEYTTKGIYSETAPVRGVPLINMGYQAIKNAAVLSANKDLIRESSLNDLITINALYDSLFTSFKPVTIKVDEFFTENNSRWTHKEPITDMYSGDVQNEKYNNAYYTNYYSNRLGERFWAGFFTGYQQEPPNWLEYLIHELVKQENIRSLEILSQRLQVAVVTIERTITEVRNRLFDSVLVNDMPDDQPLMEVDVVEEEMLQSLYIDF